MLFLIIGSVLVLSGIFRGKQQREKQYVQQGLKKCPICRNMLKKGERVFSEAYPGKGEEKIVYLYGCPYCRTRSMRNRQCPVCKRVLPEKSYLIGKMWIEEGKSRVHISCCSICGRKGMFK